jgi:hypothetical protein
MIDRAIFYPAPNPGPQVSSSTLDGISQYLTDTMRKKMGAKVSVVDKAGPGVLRMQAVKLDLKGEQLKNEKAQLTVEDFQNSMDNGIVGGTTTLARGRLTRRRKGCDSKVSSTPILSCSSGVPSVMSTDVECDIEPKACNNYRFIKPSPKRELL